jgi:hypothetical protein
VGSGTQTWKTGLVEGANGASVYEAVAVVTANGTPDRKGFFLGVLLGGGVSSSVELNMPIASA